MRLGTLYTERGTRAARVDGDETFLLPFADIGQALTAVHDIADLRANGEIGPAVGDVRFAPLVSRPGKIVCVGLNYRTHIVEMGRQLPTHPTLFAKFAEALVGARDDIILPGEPSSVDWEAELAVVIARPTRYADADTARAAIAGFSIANDVSVRDYQWRTTQWLQGKTFESTTPLGPILVTPDEVGDADDLEISCSVDHELRQRSRTSDLLFSPVDLVCYVSQIVTLAPGDVLLTGTPGGVGAGMEPPTYLSDGSVMTTAIEGIGACVNKCVASHNSAPSPQVPRSEGSSP